MANPEHTYWLREGASEWNGWRAARPEVVPDLEIADARGLNLDSCDLHGAILRGADFGNASLRNADLTRADMSQVSFVGADMSGATLSHATIVSANFSNVNLTGATLESAAMASANLTNAQLSKAVCRGAIFTAATLKGALLVETILENARFDEADLEGTLLRRANLAGASLVAVNLQKADLSGSSLVGANCSDADFRGATLTDCALCKAILRRTRFAGASLAGSDFSEAVMDRVDFQGVDLSGVVLFGSKMTSPTWRFRPPSASWSGALIVRDPVPTHPIQDVLGLPHALKRSIADAQYLVEIQKTMSGTLLQRVLFRLWGATCAFGQSLSRWASLSAVIVILFTGAYMTVEFAGPEYSPAKPLSQATAAAAGSAGQPTPSNSGPASLVIGATMPGAVDVTTVARRPGILRALYLSVMVFTGFSDMVPVSDAGRTLIAAEVVVGYMMLGALLAILANKFARLA